MKVKRWNGQRTEFAMIKRDGHQVTIRRDRYGKVMATTRTPVDITNQIKYLLGPIYSGMPNDCKLLGELWLPGEDCSQIKTAIKDQNPRLRWDAFCIARHPLREDWTAAGVELVEQLLTRWGIPHISYHRTGHWDDDWDAWMLECIAREEDWEGFILKDRNMGDMYKWKPELDIDLIVDGYTEGEGKYLGLIGSVKCISKEGYPIAQVSGMDDEMRIDLSLKRETGMVCEIQYQRTTRYGRLRHPRFKRLRDDKQPSECSAWQDPRLITYWHSEEGKHERK